MQWPDLHLAQYLPDKPIFQRFAGSQLNVGSGHADDSVYGRQFNRAHEQRVRRYRIVCCTRRQRFSQHPGFPGYVVNSATVNISCPSTPTAVLSSTPDGLSNVFQDNTIQVSDTPHSGSATTVSDVCYGGDTNLENYTGFYSSNPGATNCFQPAYESAATGYVGQNPDLAIYPNPGGAPGSFVATYGVQPLNLQNAIYPVGSSSPLYPAILQSGKQSLTVQLMDAGGELGAATLHLVTNCTLAGVTPGGSVTTNPINPSNPSSETQTASFDSGGGQNISLTTSVSVAAQNGDSVPSVTPIITDIGIPQSLFYQLVSGTSAAPAVCMRLSGELDMYSQSMCKGFWVQCNNGSTTSGNNCNPSVATLRYLYNAVQFASPDGPVNNTNYLYNTALNACSNVASGDTCATGTGPGLLMGGDGWLCASTSATCTPLEYNTMTTVGESKYSADNCALSGALMATTNCPLDLLTQFFGAADGKGGGTAPVVNSIYIPVVNMPLPSTTTTITNQNASSWVNSAAASVNFSSVPATYPETPAAYPATSASNPPNNGFTAAPVYSLTYGITPYLSPLPDTTYPISTDTTVQNSGTSTSPSSSVPLCSGTPSSLSSSATLTPGDGIYNLHYFATDCALTEELSFNPKVLNNPTVNWASFKYVTFGIDTQQPTFTCNPPPAPNSDGWYNSNLTISCTVTEPNYVANQSGSGFGAPINGIQGSPSEVVQVSTNVTSVNSAAYTNTLQVFNLAGTFVNVMAGPFQIDVQSADAAILALPFTDSIAQGTTGKYYAGVIDLSSNTADNVVVTSVFDVPNGVLGSGGISASYKLVSCSLLGCTRPSSGTSCNVNGTTIICNIGQLASLTKGKGVVLVVSIPVASNAPVNTTFTSVTTVTSADDPNTKNNSVSETYKVLK